MAKKSQPLPEHENINRGNRLDPQHPTYYRDRGKEPTEADRLSTEKTQENQKSSGK